MKKIKIFFQYELLSIWQCDITAIRTRVFLFVFNLIPDFYCLRFLRNLLLLLSGMNINIFKTYIKGNLHCDNASKLHITSGFINRYCYFEGNGSIFIDKGVQIAPHVMFCTTNHKQQDEILDIRIGKNVWIGANSTILPGVEIDNNIMIAAGSILPKGKYMHLGGGGYTLYAGNPAKIVSTKKPNQGANNEQNI